MLRCKRQITSALLIDTRLRGYVVRRGFLQVRAKVILVQSAVRRWKAVTEYTALKTASTKIAATWRGYSRFVSYRQTVEGVYFTAMSLRVNSVLR